MVTEKAMQRRLKRQVWSSEHGFLATCALGLERLLLSETLALPGVTGATVGRGSVLFRGDFNVVYHALLLLRTADSLRIELGSFYGSSYPMLFSHLLRVPWELYLPPNHSIDVRMISSHSRVRDQQAVSGTVLKAIKQSVINTATLKEPQSTRIYIRIHRDRCIVYLEAAGAPLYKRSPTTTSKLVSRAPLKETTAAALAMFAQVGDYDYVLDPFCGAGTILAEVASLIAQTPPGGHRDFALMRSPAWKPQTFEHIRGKALDGRTSLALIMDGSDTDADTIRAAATNLAYLGLQDNVRLHHMPAQELRPAAMLLPHGAHRPILISNPPYDHAARTVGGNSLGVVTKVLEQVPGWPFALLYPHVSALATASPRIKIDEVIDVTTGGRENHLVKGSIRE